VQSCGKPRGGSLGSVLTLDTTGVSDISGVRHGTKVHLFACALLSDVPAGTPFAGLVKEREAIVRQLLTRPKSWRIYRCQNEDTSKVGKARSGNDRNDRTLLL